MCFHDSLEVYSETQLDSDDASSSCNDYVDPNALNEELSIVCENLLEKYKVLKKKTFKLTKENKELFSKFDIVLQERDEISNKRDSLKSKLDLALNENKILKSKKWLWRYFEEKWNPIFKTCFCFKRKWFFDKQNYFYFKGVGFDV